MKLHLPVQLFRAVIALMAVATPFSASAAQKYTVSDGKQLTLSGLDELDLDISEYYWSSTSSKVYGGAIYATGTGSVTLEHYVSVLFNKNYAKSSSSSSSSSKAFAYGGAIYSSSGAITLSGNESVTFSGNYAKSSSSSSYDGYSYGGAIYSESGDITLSGNKSVTFSGNDAISYAYSSIDILAFPDSSAYGGAIYSSSGAITLSGNKSVTFSGNRAYSDSNSYAYSYGGAIYSDSGDITLSGNKSVTFSGNRAYSESSADYSYGGAIYSKSGAITLSGNESVTFSGNYAYGDSSAYGGAIYSSSGDITLSGNGSVTFSGNYAYSDDYSYGGAIRSSSGPITLSGNKSVTFSGNYAYSSYDSAYGGAIYSKSGDITLSGNESVLFEKNYEKSGSSYRLRSIYLNGGSNSRFTLSAPEGGIIEFRDGIYVGGGVVSYNAPLIEADGAELLQTGDILFTGAYTEAHLKKVKGGTAGTEAEILNSRLTQVLATTNLYGGRLRVEDGAYYLGKGLIAAENGHATVLVKNATMDHAGYDMVFHSGSCLVLEGATTLMRNLTMNSGSSLSFDDSSYISVGGNLTLGDGVRFIYTGDTETAAENTILLCVGGEVSGWNKANLVLNGGVQYTDLTWVNGDLLLNYNAATFNPYYHGDISYTQRVTTGLTLCHYNKIAFSNIGTSSSSSAAGGAINSSSGSITLSWNKSVTFSDNYATTTSSSYSSYGGAIYSYSGAITLSGNESVTFSGNYAESPSSYYYHGGAIHSYSGAITLSGNESVLFEKNYEKRGSSYRLRSIYLNGGSNSRFTLSAPEGGIIEFRDGIYIGGGVVSYNAPLIEADGAEHLQTGDILFTGAYTEAHLKAVKGGTAGTEAEIHNSRLTQVLATTNLYGGRLRVEDGAYYQGKGLIAAENGHATVLVKDATLDHDGYDMAFHSGSCLVLSGKTTLLGNLTMNSGTSLTFDVSTDNYLDGNLTLGDGVSIVVTGNAENSAENTVLVRVRGEISGWDKESIVVDGDVQYTDLTWVYGELILNYNSSSFNPYRQGELSYTQRRTSALARQLYNKITISNINYSSSDNAYGGAIYGSSSGTIMLSGNGSVSISDNSVASTGSDAPASYSSRGGAIYSESGAITLSGNESVTFSGNSSTTTSSTSSSSAETYSDGGAIYCGNGDITLSGNKNVTFTGNYAYADCSIETYTYGGAIYNDRGDISLRGNDYITFSENYAKSSGYSCAGAICGTDIYICDNGSVIFSGNRATSSSIYAYGGAIYGDEIFIRDNRSVIFKQNYEKTGSTYRLRGLYATGNTSLSAASGNYIEFQEGMYVGGKLELNSLYTYEGGKSVAQTGDIIYTGANAAEYLRSIKRAYTDAELNNSLTSDVGGKTTLYDGRLIIREGAIFNGSGLTIVSSASGYSTPTVVIENARMNHENATINFASGTSLVASGQSAISTTSLTMGSGSSLTLHVNGENADEAVLSLNGILTFGDSLTLNLSFEEGKAGLYKLMSVNSLSNSKKWTKGRITVNGLDGAVVKFDDLYWANNELWLTYRGSIPKLTVATWNNVSGDREWNTASENWRQGEFNYAYVDGVDVVFGDAGAGAIKIVGNLNPGSVLVESTADYTWSGNGCICGDATLTKLGGGTLTINNANSYTGGTLINGGKVVVGNAEALGTGAVSVNGAILEIRSNGFTNALSFGGNSGLTIGAGITYALQSVISNKGVLSLSGHFKADALSPQFIGDGVRVDVAGNEGGTSGFLRTSDFSVAIASGTLDSSNATVSYKGQVLRMNGGVGYGIGTVDYSNYLLTDGNSASVSDILDAANGALEDITMTGGKLTVDDSVVLDATGGNINITADSTLSGSMVDADITTAEGEYENTISAGIGGDSSLTVNGGTITVTGDNTYTGGTIINGGMLNVGSDTSLGSGDVTLNKGTLDLGEFAVGNDILATGGTLSGADNYEGKLTVDGDVVLDGDIVAQGGIELNGGSISGGGIVDTDVTIHTEGYTDVDFDITGDSSLTINGGDVIITGGNNDYTGGTTLNGGSLTIGSTGTLGSGVVTLNGGVLNTNETELTNDIVNNGGTVVSNYVLDKGRTLTIGVDGATFVGDIVLSGGLLYFEGMPLTVNGKVSGGDAPVSVHVTGYSVLDAADTVLLADFGDQVVGLGLNNFVNIGGGELIYDSTTNTLYLKLADENTWLGGRGATWTTGSNVGWKDGDAFATGNRVVFNTGGSVKIVGEVAPSSLLVDIEKSLTFSTSYNKKTGLYSGTIVGKGCVVKRGKGMLTLNDGNEYTGGTFIEAGTVKAKGTTSFGTGAITLSGGAVDLASKAVANDIVLEGSAAVKGGKKYEGEFTMNGGELLKGSLINVAEDATLQSGVVNGTLSGVGTVAVSGEVTLGDSGKITTNALEIDGALSVSAKGLVMNSKASAITIDGGTLSSAGKISAYSLSMEGGKLDVTNGKPMGITLKDAFSATDGANIDLYGALTANQLTLEGVDFTMAMDAADIAPKVQPKAQSITLKGKGVLNTVSDSELDIAGKVSVTGDLALLDSVVMLHDVAGAAKPKAQGLTVKGVLIADGTELVTTGAVSAAALTASESVIAIAAQEGLSAQSLKLTRKDATKGVPQENILYDCAVYVNGSMSVAGNLQLQESYLALRDYSGKKKAMGLRVKGDLSLSSDSYLKLTGALSAKNLTLDAGSSLTLGSAKLSTVKVSGALTLNGVVNFDLGFTVTEKDVAKGKEYTLFSFKSLVGDVSNLTLGYEGEYTLALNAKGTAITLTVTDAAAWNAYVADIQESLNAAPAVADAVGTPEEEVEAEELLLKPVAATTDIDPLLAKAADTLVQSTWGTVGASRAFGETIAGRGRNATMLGEDGKGAAWLSVMGGSSRISSAEGHNGADFTLSGAAFGVEGRVGEKSTLGVTIGNSWGKVSTFSAFPVDQDSMHVGIYGNHTLTKSLTLSWMATHTRTESDATILGAPYSWSQDALQLDARLTWGKSISDKTAVSAFAGLQYLTTDSGECAGLKTGSLQNLRAELGVGASHKCSDSTMVFGELSFIGDMVRNNPTAAIGDYRTHGTNPGRVGLNLSVGAQHQLSEDWSVNASYSLELMENSTSHSLNVGASYSF